MRESLRAHFQPSTSLFSPNTIRCNGFHLEFDALQPYETTGGCFTYKLIEPVLQAIVDVGRRIGHPVANSERVVDFAYSFDAGAFGGTILSANLIYTRDGHGARDVRNCHVLGVGEIADNGYALKHNFPHFLTFVNGIHILLFFTIRKM